MFFNFNAHKFSLLCRFVQYYPNDVDDQELLKELTDYGGLLLKKVGVGDAIKLFNVLIEVEDLCPNLKAVLQICLTIGCSIASCERSFSKLKLIKTYLRSSMSQDRLRALALISIEKDILKNCDFADLVDEFVNKKIRRIMM